MRNEKWEMGFPSVLKACRNFMCPILLVMRILFLSRVSHIGMRHSIAPNRYLSIWNEQKGPKKQNGKLEVMKVQNLNEVSIAN